MVVPKVAIVIPFADWNDWVLDCIRACDRQTKRDFEIWLLPDEAPSPEWKSRLEGLCVRAPVHLEPTGSGNPAKKRNIALRQTRAGIIALVDADAAPREDWLEKGLNLLGEQIGVVTGPNVTPPQDALSQRVAGHVMESPLGFGAAYLRHTPVPRQTVREMPTCNMIFRRQPNLLFREDLDTGEDMMFCSDMRARGERILYDPEVVVYHHRRRLFRPFMQQFFRYGRDKGRLARAGRDVTYPWQALPALLVLYLIGFILLNLAPVAAWLRWLCAMPLLLYALAVLLESLRRCHSVAEVVLALPAFPAAHLSYGTGYLIGLADRY